MTFTVRCGNYIACTVIVNALTYRILRQREYTRIGIILRIQNLTGSIPVFIIEICRNHRIIIIRICSKLTADGYMFFSVVVIINIDTIFLLTDCLSINICICLCQNFAIRILFRCNLNMFYLFFLPFSIINCQIAICIFCCPDL